jgi:hypothetical protein
MVVGELQELEKTPFTSRSENGFNTFITGIWARVDHDTGELWLDDEDLRQIHRYKRSGYGKRLRAIFERTLGPDLDGAPIV